jgi:hypothetical protein
VFFLQGFSHDLLDSLKTRRTKERAITCVQVMALGETRGL